MISFEIRRFQDGFLLTYIELHTEVESVCLW